MQDEPTTGLDASVANVVARTLKQLAQNGRTVLLSIHQPRFSIFREFDRLVLITDGELVYTGPAADSLAYFADVGYTIGMYNNPAEFFLDWCGGGRGREKKGASAACHSSMFGWMRFPAHPEPPSPLFFCRPA